MMGRYELTRFANALWVLIVCLVLTGAYAYQFGKGLNPCPLCELQRLSLISMAIGPLLNLKFGIRMGHYSWALISALFGAFVAMRQICLHICPSFRQWGVPVFGLQLYTWSLIVFAASILGCALLLSLYRAQDNKLNPKMNLFEGTVAAYLILLALANTITTLMQCGLGPCSG